MKNITVILVICLTGFLFADQTSKQNSLSKYTRSFYDANGKEIIEVKVPGVKPEDRISGRAVQRAELENKAVGIIDGVPVLDWCYGCTATSATMYAGYFDRNGYDNIYTGPTNGGVMPLNNSSWGYGECSLSATHNGYDDLTEDGHVDNFWVDYGESGNDPIGSGDPTATYENCLADFMGTSQDWWSNSDGSTTYFSYPDGTPLHDYSGNESSSPRQRDAAHGIKLFFESRGYEVTANYNQVIKEQSSNPEQGFTFENLKSEIDNNYPVLVHVVGHTMLAVGYKEADGTGANQDSIYIHDTWNHEVHIMAWNGVYQDMQHRAMTVIHLAPPTSNDFYVQNQAGSPLEVNQGETINVSCDQYYNGTSSSTLNSGLGYYLSDNTSLGGSDILLGSDTSSLSSSNTSESESATLTIPAETESGTYYILFVADYEDDYSETNEANNVEYIQITVNAVDQNIVVSNLQPAQLVGDAWVPDNQTIDENQSISFSITASDPDGNDLEYSWKVDDSEVSVASSYNFTTDYNSADDYVVTLNVTDNFSAKNALNYSWNVTVNNVNRSPVIESFSPATQTLEVFDTEVMNFSVTASDPDSDELTYSWVLDEVVQDSQTNSFSHQFSEGNYELEVTVSDGEASVSTSWTIESALGIHNELMPEKTMLYSCYPNPFNPSSNIKFGLKEDSEVELSLYNLKGEMIRTLMTGNLKAGYHLMKFNADNLPSGNYFIYLKANNKVFSQKVILIK